jgi:hypothetical protein
VKKNLFAVLTIVFACVPASVHSTLTPWQQSFDAMVFGYSQETQTTAETVLQAIDNKTAMPEELSRLSHDHLGDVGSELAKLIFADEITRENRLTAVISCEDLSADLRVSVAEVLYKFVPENLIGKVFEMRKALMLGNHD